MNVVLYARVSTEQQAEKDLSIPAQIRLMRSHAADHGMVVIGEFTDVGSGRSFRDRPGLMAAVARCTDESAHVDRLIVYRLDRVGRNLSAYLALREKLRRHGVSIEALVEHVDDSPAGVFVEELMAAQAEFYSANLSQEVKRGLTERLKHGRWVGVLPLGYVQHDESITLDSVRAPLLRQAFLRFAEGRESTTAIAEWLNTQGCTTKTGRMMTGKALCHLFKNPFYIGVMRTGGVEYKGAHPPLVERNVFERCQHLFVARHHKSQVPRTNRFLLARLVVCPSCAAGHLVGEIHRKRSARTWRYYRCHRPGCHFTIHADDLERNVLQSPELIDLIRTRRDTPTTDELDSLPIDLPVLLRDRVRRIELRNGAVDVVLGGAFDTSKSVPTSSDAQYIATAVAGEVAWQRTD